jgi:hypothetical protein
MVLSLALAHTLRIGRTILVLLINLLLQPVVRAEPVFVFVNQASSAAAALPKNALSAVFGMRLRTWPDGSPIKVFVLPSDHLVHIRFCKQVLRVFPHQLRTAWDRLVYSGTGQAPTEVGSEAEMREKLATTPGAIGYLERNSLDDNIKILPTD